MTTRPLRQTHNDDGFSLLETLFALAIMSLASVALFQSTSSMLGLSERAVKAGERTINDGLDRMALSTLVDSILPAWPDTQETAFSGNADSFRGLTTGAPQTGLAAPVNFELRLREQSATQTALLYIDLDKDKRENTRREDEGWVILEGLPAGTTFAYRGIDSKDYDIWPPKEKPVRGFFDDSLLTMPPLPEAVSLKTREGFIIWTAKT